MHVFARIWTTVTCVVNWFTFSSVDKTSSPQLPIPGDLDLGHTVFDSDGPVFYPPSGRPGSDFQCDYSNMPGWEECSDAMDRGCWLRHPDGREFNIYTNYETLDGTPTGIDRYYTLEVDEATINADGIAFTEAKVFNDQYPGPWIQACWGDRVHITVKNNLANNGTSIHWHGIRQWKSMQMDGVNGITQCPIAPKDKFVYTWRAMQYGSSWYHSHYSVQYADGLQGPITIHGPSSYPYDEPKLPLIMTDWGHNTAFQAIYAGLEDPSILLNGVGNVNRFSGRNINTSPIPPTYELHFDKSVSGSNRKKRYLLRLINTSFDTMFVFSIDNHVIWVIEADFVPIFPYTTNSVLIGIGQRYNVIVEADPKPVLPGTPIPTDGNFWIRTIVPESTGRCGTSGAAGYDRAGILRYDDSSTADPTSEPWPNIPTRCSDEPYASMTPTYEWHVGPPINNAQAFSVSGPGNATYALAGFSFMPAGASTSYALQINYSDPIFLDLDRTPPTWPPLWVVVPEDYTDTDWVYLVLTGSFHPIHLHGHDFAILYDEVGTPYDPTRFNFTCTDFPTPQNPLKCHNPPRRDVILLPPGGFAVIAFKTDNPGSWLMHCHIAYHASFGLALQILERQADANALWPVGSAAWTEADRVCSNWKDWWNQNVQDDSGI